VKNGSSKIPQYLSITQIPNPLIMRKNEFFTPEKSASQGSKGFPGCSAFVIIIILI
jgi:hypothetical protein